jgi:succinate dehydrogenase / fumarate reductase flavoprotein subunit
MWDHCGMARNREGLEKALSEIPALRAEFDQDLRVLGVDEGLNQSLERAGRVADFFELAELMCTDALRREESCGGHFRVEHQTEDGEARRDDEHFAHVAAWRFAGPRKPPEVTTEPLEFDHVHLAQRSYR